MAYQVPQEEVLFVLKHITPLKQLLALPAYSELSMELIDAVLDENARFVQEVVAPLNAPADLQGATLYDGKVTTADGFKEALHAYTAAGWQGLQHPEAFGGQGLPKTVHAVVTENLNAASLAFSLCPLLSDGVIEALLAAASPELQERYIPALIEGRWTGTMNLTEAQAGSDLALLQTRAVRQDDDSYRITGQKIFITYGEHDLAENIIHLVLARTPDAPEGVKGISLFVVPKYLVNDDGSLGQRNDVWCSRLEDKMGIHASPTAELLYGNNKGEVGAGAIGYLVGQENKGLNYMFIMMNAARYAVGLQGVGIAEHAWQQARQYAHERVQGQALDGSKGSVVIAKHPDVDRMLQTMRGLTEGARAFSYWAAGINDLALQSTGDEAEGYQALYEFLVPVVKAFSTEMANEVTSLAIQVFGGMGYIEETGVAQHYRDARILAIYEGTTGIQANDFIGRKLLRDQGAVAAKIANLIADDVIALKQAAAATQDQQATLLTMLAEQLGQALADYQASTQHVLTLANASLPAVFYASVPLLTLTGTLLAGWKLARSVLLLQEGLSVSVQYRQQKNATAVFYMTNVLPRTKSYAQQVQLAGFVTPYAAQTNA